MGCKGQLVADNAHGIEIMYLLDLFGVGWLQKLNLEILLKKFVFQCNLLHLFEILYKIMKYLWR